MGMGRIIVAGLVLFALLAPAGARPIHKDDDDWVPDSRIAVLVAEIVLKKAMGEAGYDDYVKESPLVYDSPLQAELRGPTWYVVRRPGPRPAKVKDAFVIGVARHDARLLRLPAAAAVPRLSRGDLVPDAKTAAAVGDVLLKRGIGEEFYLDLTQDSFITDGTPLLAELSKDVWYVSNNSKPPVESGMVTRPDGSRVFVIPRQTGFTVQIAKRDGQVRDIVMRLR